MSKAYPTNLTQDQFELLNDLIPEPKPGGRPREVDMWEVLNAIFYLLCEGCQWRALPGDFPSWQTVYTYFRNWRKDGTWLHIHDRLREWTRIEQERHPSPSEAIIDSQSVKSAAMVSQSVGYDAGFPDQRAQAVYDGRYLGFSLAGMGHRSECGRTRGRKTCAQACLTDGLEGISPDDHLGGWRL